MKSLRVTFLLHILIDPFWSYWQSGGSEVAVPVSVVSSESEVYEVEIDQLRELQLLQSVANPCFSCLLELLNIALSFGVPLLSFPQFPTVICTNMQRYTCVLGKNFDTSL